MNRKHPIVSIYMDNGAVIKCELYPEEAPNTVNSFLYLASLGCFNNHAIERIAPDFVADISFTAYHKTQARYLIAYETRDAGFPNHLDAVPGTIVMGGYDQGIAGGEFFFPFCHKDSLVSHYPAFGKVISGMDEIMRWNTLEVKKITLPLDPPVTLTVPVNAPVITHVETETFGFCYPEPIKLKDVPLPDNWQL